MGHSSSSPVTSAPSVSSTQPSPAPVASSGSHDDGNHRVSHSDHAEQQAMAIAAVGLVMNPPPPAASTGTRRVMPHALVTNTPSQTRRVAYAVDTPPVTQSPKRWFHRSSPPKSKGTKSTASGAGGLMELPSDLFTSLMSMCQPRELCLLSLLCHRGYNHITRGSASDRMWLQWLTVMYPDLAHESKYEWPRLLAMIFDQQPSPSSYHHEYKSNHHTPPRTPPRRLSTSPSSVPPSSTTATATTPASTIIVNGSPPNRRRSSIASHTRTITTGTSTGGSHGTPCTAVVTIPLPLSPVSVHGVLTSSPTTASRGIAIGAAIVTCASSTPTTIVDTIQVVINGICRQLPVCARTLLIHEHNRVPLQLAAARELRDAAISDERNRARLLWPCRTFDTLAFPFIIAALICIWIVLWALRLAASSTPYWGVNKSTPIVAWYYMIPLFLLILFVSSLYYGNWIIQSCPTRVGYPSNILQDYPHDHRAGYMYTLVHRLHPMLRMGLALVPVCVLIWATMITIRLSGAINTSYLLIVIPLVLSWLPCCMLLAIDILAYIGVFLGMAVPFTIFVVLFHWRLQSGWDRDTDPSMTLIMMPLFALEVMTCGVSLFATGRVRSCRPWFMYIACVAPFIACQAMIIGATDSGHAYSPWIIAIPLIALTILPLLYVVHRHMARTERGSLCTRCSVCCDTYCTACAPEQHDEESEEMDDYA